MSKSKRLLFVGVPAIFIFAVIYPHLPWHNLGLCAFKRIVGFGCPGCGFIRSVVALLNGRFRESVDLNPMGIVAIAILTAIWLKTFVVSPIVRRDTVLSPQVIKMVSLLFVAGLFIQWIFCLAIEISV